MASASVRRRLTAALAVLAVTLSLATVALLVPEKPARADARYRFFHFNMCGNVCNDGATGDVVTAIRRSISDFKPVAVSLNEVCRSQFFTLLRRLARAGYRMNGRWLQTKGTANSCANDRYGIAVLSRRPIKRTQSWRLPRPTAEVRKLLCVTAYLGRKTKVCTTHITHLDADKPPQIRRVAEVMNRRFARRTPIVLMGDFNVTPSEDPLDRIYRSANGQGGTGRFQELDEREGADPPCRCGEPTLERFFTDAKIDYIFVTARHFRSVWADATHSAYSDHDPLRGSAVLRN